MASTESKALETHYNSLAERLEADPSIGLVEMRSMLEELHVRAAEPSEVCYEEIEANGVPAILCTPTGAAPGRVILYLHGGGFALNSMHSHRKLAAHLAKATGVAALVLDYRLAPEHPYPAQIDDATNAYRWLLDNGFDSIALAGDSAGGNLAVSTALRLRAEEQKSPPAIVGFSSWLDMECGPGTLDDNAATDAFVQRPVAEAMVAMYLGGASPTDPGANPLHADLSELPPVYLAASTTETLRDSSERLIEQARAAGVDATLHLEPDMQHVWVFMAGRAPEADATIADAARWLRPKLGLS